MPVPISRTSFASRSADEAWDALSRMYTGARPQTASSQARIAFDTAATPDIAVDRGWLSAAEGAFDASPGQLNLISVLDGRISLDFGRRGRTTSLAGGSYVYLPDSSATLEWDAFSALTVRLPMSTVARSASELTGIDPDALRFFSLSPPSAAHRRLWLRTARMLWQQLSDPHSLAANPLVHRELISVVTAAVVSVFPNSALTDDGVAVTGDVRPSALRRAVEYVDSHASLAITVTDIADAAGTTPRALRAAFRRGLDTTPTAYLRRVRLEAARRDLLAADPTTGETVEQVAARWGFADRARFRADYARAYGHPPDHDRRG